MSEVATVACTGRHIHVMRSALGLGYADKPYRNKFAVYPQGDNYSLCSDLERMGLMDRFYTAPSGMVFFGVTLAGHQFLGVEPERDRP